MPLAVPPARTSSEHKMINGMAGTSIAAPISAEFRRPWPRNSIQATMGTVMLSHREHRLPRVQAARLAIRGEPGDGQEDGLPSGHPDHHGGEHFQEMQPERRYPHSAPDGGQDRLMRAGVAPLIEAGMLALDGVWVRTMTPTPLTSDRGHEPPKNR